MENIRTMVVYVGGTEPKAYEVRLLHEDIEELIAEAELMIDAVRDFVGTKSGFVLDDFDWATSGKICQWCSFQQICQRELT